MTVRRPEIFVSATSGDLRSCRQLVKEALLTLGCVPVEQTNFPPDTRTVREMLRARIAACDAVMHIAGECYGAEPRDRDPQQPRRSYTQLEYDLARELRKPVYLFICGDDFPYDEHPPEDAEKQELQRAHRGALGASETLRTRIRTRDELGQRVRELQTQVETLGRELAHTRAWLRRAIWAGIAAVLVLAATFAVMHRQDQRTALRDATIGRSIEVLADRVNQFAATNTGATKEELFARAIDTMAAEMKVDAGELRGAIETFVQRVRANPRANFVDRARADFAEQRFADAAQHADRAADELRAESEAAEREAAVSVERARVARAKEREMRTLGGDAQLAADRFADAQAMFERALALAPREREAPAWAALQLRLAQCAWRQAQQQAGPAVATHIATGEAACRAALTVYSRTQFPSEWATAHKHLGNVLQLKAGATPLGAARASHLALAVEAYRAALEVHTPESNLEEWLFTRNNLGLALYNQAFATTGAEQLRLFQEAAQEGRTALARTTAAQTPRAWGMLQTNLGQTLATQAFQFSGEAQSKLQNDAVAAFTAALTVFPRATRADDWGRVQNMLASVLLAQAQTKNGADRTRALTEATEAFRGALEVYTRDAAPQMWSTTIFNLGYAQSLLADSGSPEEQRAWLDAAVDSYRSALEVRTRDALPQAWAITHLYLGYALQRRAFFAASAEKTVMQAAAADSLRQALEIFTPQDLPSQWGTTQLTLATLLQAQAEASEPTQRGPLLDEALASGRAALTVFSRENTPQPWSTVQLTLASLMQAQAELATGSARVSLLANAAQTARDALDVFPRDGGPGTWGYALNTLAMILRLQAETPEHPDRAAIAAEAVATSRTVLEDFTRLPGTLAFGTAQGYLADALRVQSEFLPATDQKSAREEAEALYRAALTIITTTVAEGENKRLTEHWHEVQAALTATATPP